MRWWNHLQSAGIFVLEALITTNPHTATLNQWKTLTPLIGKLNISSPPIFSVHFVPSLLAERWHLKELDTFSKSSQTGLIYRYISTLTNLKDQWLRQNWIRAEIMSPRPLVVFIRLTSGVPPTAGFCDWKVSILKRALEIRELFDLIEVLGYFLLGSTSG